MALLPPRRSKARAHFQLGDCAVLIARLGQTVERERGGLSTAGQDTSGSRGPKTYRVRVSILKLNKPEFKYQQ
jgi:hypothetical protein